MMKTSVKFRSCPLVVAFFLLAVGRDPQCHCEATIEVFNITCDPTVNKTDCQSESLEAIAEKLTKFNETVSDLEVHIKIRQLWLNTTLNFTNLSSLIIRGESYTEMTNNILSVFIMVKIHALVLH